MFESFPADFIFSHPINLVLLNYCEVCMEKKQTNSHNNDTHGKINE